ncbi:hypothetical protein AGMMS49957_16280 [Synergistales bacterium]|nr:hypothetical protein AGMMS49957_16280 [Synergistales bacterium]
MNEPQNFPLQFGKENDIKVSLQAVLPPERESIMKGQNSKITALYSRLSKDDIFSGESQSISNQKLDLEKYAKEHNFANLRHYSDDGFSGVDFERPSWQEMMTEVEAGNVGVILVRTLDRMGRNYLQTGLHRERFHECGVRLISTADGYDSAKGEDDLVPIREIMSEWYARDTSRKAKSVLHAKGKRGEHMTNAAVYGYKKSSDDKNLWLVDNEAANVVRRVFQMTIDGNGI